MKQLLTILFFLGLFVPLAVANSYYGNQALANIKQYGIEVRSKCSKELQQHEALFKDVIKDRLVRRNINVVERGNVILKLQVSAISSNDGFYVVHFLLELHQTAYLALNNKYTEAAVWDAWKMGEYREQELLREIDDLVRVFLNEYISKNP